MRAALCRRSRRCGNSSDDDSLAWMQRDWSDGTYSTFSTQLASPQLYSIVCGSSRLTDQPSLDATVLWPTVQSSLRINIFSPSTWCLGCFVRELGADVTLGSSLKGGITRLWGVGIFSAKGVTKSHSRPPEEQRDAGRAVGRVREAEVQRPDAGVRAEEHAHAGAQIAQAEVGLAQPRIARFQRCAEERSEE